MKLYVFLVILTVFSLSIRLYRLGEPPKYYFDEVYHAVTAKAYADNNKDAYDPFARAPKPGTAYDWLHPPFAKLVQAGSIKIFGDEPVGWRLPSVIFGTGIILATFFLANNLFGKKTAVFSSLVVAFENLNLVMSRITMNDVFITFFTIVAFFFAAKYIKKKKFSYLFASSFFAGLAYASKWTGLYSVGAIFLFIFIWEFVERKLNFKILTLIIVPPLIYLASYSQFFLQGHTVREFMDLHKQIWWYQNRHDLKHSYGTTPLFCVPNGLGVDTKPCPWILNVRGVYFSYEDYGNQKSGYIYALGNPLTFWVGLIAVSYILGKYFENKDKKILLVLLGYFIFWVPWIFSPRILFLYHYLPALPFLSIATGYALAEIYDTKFKYLAIITILILALSFFYFYPISSGFPIKTQDIDKYMWLRTWR